MTILLPVWRFWLLGVILTVGNGTAVMSPVVGPGHSGGKWGPVLGVTALPASTPITLSVEEYPTVKLTPIYRFWPSLIPGPGANMKVKISPAALPADLPKSR